MPRGAGLQKGTTETSSSGGYFQFRSSEEENTYHNLCFNHSQNRPSNGVVAVCVCVRVLSICELSLRPTSMLYMLLCVTVYI